VLANDEIPVGMGDKGHRFSTSNIHQQAVKKSIWDLGGDAKNQNRKTIRSRVLSFSRPHAVPVDRAATLRRATAIHTTHQGTADQMLLPLLQSHCCHCCLHYAASAFTLCVAVVVISSEPSRSRIMHWALTAQASQSLALARPPATNKDRHSTHNL
jgi:hypothetical protein